MAKRAKSDPKRPIEAYANLVLAGKAEHSSFEVQTVSLHRHEHIQPKRVIEAVKKLPSPQPSPRGSKGEGIQPLLFEQKRADENLLTEQGPQEA